MYTYVQFEVLLSDEHCSCDYGVARSKQVLIPFRRYMTWLPAVKEGSQGQQKLIQFAKVVLQAFRESKGITSEHTDGEVQAMLKDDKSIMAHILSNSYPSEEHRLSDVIVFLVAGNANLAFCWFFTDT